MATQTEEDSTKPAYIRQRSNSDPQPNLETPKGINTEKGKHFNVR